MQNHQEINQSNEICDLSYTNNLYNKNETNDYNFSFEFHNTQNLDIEITNANSENVCIDESQNTIENQIIEVDSKFQEYRKSDSDKYKKLFLKLQKLNKIYCESLLLQIQFPHYLKSSTQVLKKANQSRNLSNNIIKFIVHYAQYKRIDQQYIQISSKILRLCQEFDKIDNFQLVDLKQFLSKQDNDSIENVWTKQQIIQCFILYVVTQCEMFIQNFYKKQHIPIRNKDISNHTKMCTYDYSWSENCFGNIRDFNSKLAQKLNKRYQIIRNINQEDKQKSISIFNYTQSVLGYYHHYYSYSKMKLERENKEKIKLILQNQQVECDLQTLLIIANARMYVQLLYSLNDLQKL